jgi:hypothetical protein
MPVNLLPIIIPVVLAWIVCLGFLFRWRFWSGFAFIGASLAIFIFVGSNLNRERQFDEKMNYNIIGSGKGAFAEFTTSEGESITVVDEAIIEMLRARTENKAQVKMSVWYSFGRLRSYRVVTVERRHVYP